MSEVRVYTNDGLCIYHTAVSRSPVLLDMNHLGLGNNLMISSMDQIEECLTFIRKQNPEEQLDSYRQVKKAAKVLMQNLDEIYIERGDAWDSFCSFCLLTVCYSKHLFDIKIPLRKWSAVSPM